LPPKRWSSRCRRHLRAAPGSVARKLVLALVLCTLGATPARAQTVVIERQLPPTDDFAYELRGVFLHATFVVDTFGKAIPVLIDAQWSGVKSDARKYLLLWDCAGGFTGGYGGNTDSKFFFFGANLGASGELGRRLMPQAPVSPYLGARAIFEGSAVAMTGVALDAYDTVNSVAGLGGFNGALALRVNFGASALSRTHSLVAGLFLQESVREPGSFASGPLFSELGARGQLDLEHDLNAAIELTYGTTFAAYDSVFEVTNEARRFAATASLRKMLGRYWLSLDGKITGTSNTAIYRRSPIVYRTSVPTVGSLGLAFGVSL